MPQSRFESIMKHILPAAIIAALLIAMPSIAQQQRAMTIDQAIAIGIENSKTLHTSVEKADAADAHVSEMNAGRLPSLKFNGSYTRLSDVPPQAITFLGTQYVIAPTILENWNFQLTVQQPLFTGFRLEKSSSIAARNADAAHLDYEKDRRDFVYNVRTAYWNVFKTNDLKKVVDETVDQTNAHLVDVQNLFKQGLATTNDVLKVQVQLSNVKFQQIDAVNNVQLASMTLDNLIGLPVDTQIDATSTPGVKTIAFGERSTLVQSAIEKRPDILAMQQRLQASEDAVSMARSGWWPQLYLTGSYLSAKPNQRIFPTRDQFDDTWSAGVSATWDVWTWGTAGYQTSQAESQRAQTEDALGLLKDGVTLEVSQNVLQLDKAKDRISVAQEGVTQAEENLRVTNEKYKQGLILNSEVLDAEVAMQQAKTNYTQAVVDFELAQAGLEKSIGN